MELDLGSIKKIWKSLVPLTIIYFMSDYIKAFGLASYTVFGVLGFKLYGASIIVMLFGTQLVLGLLDIMLGYYIARRKMIVTSKSFITGFVDKSTRTIYSGVIIGICAHIASLTANDVIITTVSIVACGMCAIFSYGELLSIIENQIVISDGKNKTILIRLAKVLGIGLDLTMKKAENKVAQTLGIPIEAVVEVSQPMTKEPTSTPNS